MGYEMAFDLDYQPTDGSDPFSTWFARCPRCERVKSRRVTAAHAARHGDVEPVAYLDAWMQTPCPVGRSHALVMVSQGMVDARVAIAGNVVLYAAVREMFGL